MDVGWRYWGAIGAMAAVGAVITGSLFLPGLVLVWPVLAVGALALGWSDPALHARPPRRRAALAAAGALAGAALAGVSCVGTLLGVLVAFDVE